MKYALIVAALFAGLALGTCSIKVWHFDKASPAEQQAFLSREGLKLARKPSILQQEFSRIIAIRIAKNNRAVDIHVLLELDMGAAQRSSLAKEERLQLACADYNRSPLSKAGIEATTHLRRPASRAAALPASKTKSEQAMVNSTVVDSFKLTPTTCAAAAIS